MYLFKKNNLQVYSKSLFLIPGSADGSGVLHQSAEGRKASGRDLLTVRAPCLPAFQEPATELLQDLDHLPPNSTEPYKRHPEPQLGRTWDGMAPLRDMTCLQPGLASSSEWAVAPTATLGRESLWTTFQTGNVFMGHTCQCGSSVRMHLTHAS